MAMTPACGVALELPALTDVVLMLTSADRLAWTSAWPGCRSLAPVTIPGPRPWSVPGRPLAGADAERDERRRSVGERGRGGGVRHRNEGPVTGDEPVVVA